MPSIRHLSPLRLWQPQRRKLVSTSSSAATGMHIANQIALPTNRATISFWMPRVGSEGDNTFWASHNGGYQIQGDGSNVNMIARVPSNKPRDFPAWSIGDWHFFTVHVGFNFTGGIDMQLYFDAVAGASRDTGSESTELTTLGSHWLFGDDPASGPTTDDGFVGEAFDFCLFNDIIPIDQLQFRNGEWVDLSEDAKRFLVYRIDGQQSDPGWDSSGYERHFEVENGGVTLSSDDLPPGANIAPLRWVPFVPAASASAALNLDRLSSMHFMRPYEPTSMGE